MQNKEQQKLAGISVGGQPHSDCEPWQRLQGYVDAHEQTLLLTKTDERPTEKCAEREKKKCFTLIYKTEYNIWKHFVELICNLHLISILIQFSRNWVN